MKYSWLVRKNRRRLIVFCNGWGMDPEPFKTIGSDDYDVLCLYDYRDLEVPGWLAAGGEAYESSVLIAWSMGVWAAPSIPVDVGLCFKRSIAINGTLEPISDTYGIPVETYCKTMNDWDDETQQRFYRRMCKETGVLKRFLSHPPRRSTAGQKRELEVLWRCVPERTFVPADFYSDVVVSERDLIVPAAHQKAFWQGKKSVISLDGCHFPFWRWQRWDDIVELVRQHGRTQHGA